MRIKFPRSTPAARPPAAEDGGQGQDDLDHCARRAAEAFIAANRASHPGIREQLHLLAHRLQEDLDSLRRQRALFRGRS